MIAAAVAVALAAVGTAETAAAHTVRYESKVTLNDPLIGPFKRGTFRYTGKVKSERRSCYAGREVTMVYRSVDGSTTNELGSTTADSNGRWSFDVNANPPGDYFARIEKLVRERPGHRHVCLADRSRAFERRF